MIIKHKELVEKARKILIEKGFTEEEIFKEYSLKLKDGSTKRLDIVGINKERIIGIECGGLTREIKDIEEVLDEFILLPYVTKKANKYHCVNCDYFWISRVEKPKACPNCKRYFTFPKPKKKEQEDAF